MIPAINYYPSNDLLAQKAHLTDFLNGVYYEINRLQYQKIYAEFIDKGGDLDALMRNYRQHIILRNKAGSLSSPSMDVGGKTEATGCSGSS